MLSGLESLDWFSGLREPLAKTAYRDIWINFTGLFVLLSIPPFIFLRKKEGRKEKVKRNDRGC